MTRLLLIASAPAEHAVHQLLGWRALQAYEPGPHDPRRAARQVVDGAQKQRPSSSDPAWNNLVHNLPQENAVNRTKVLFTCRLNRQSGFYPHSNLFEAVYKLISRIDGYKHEGSPAETVGQDIR
jgi:hypothetical protein